MLEVGLTVALVEEGDVEVEEEGVIDDVETGVPADCVTELLVVVVELRDPTELVDVEVGVVVPPDDGAEAM